LFQEYPGRDDLLLRTLLGKKVKSREACWYNIFQGKFHKSLFLKMNFFPARKQAYKEIL
jgi:hypothetical protein